MLFVFKGTNQVDPALYEQLTSSLEGMHSLKRFAVFSKSLEYPLLRSLLLGATVYISDIYVGKCTHKVFNEDGQHYAISVVSPSSDGVHYSYHGNSGYN